MQTVVTDILARRRDRAIAILLGFKERECDKHLPRETQIKLRKVVLDQVNEMFELTVDIMKSLDDGERTLNEVYLQRLEEKLDYLVERVEV